MVQQILLETKAIVKDNDVIYKVYILSLFYPLNHDFEP